jgi:hypothetical protein
VSRRSKRRRGPHRGGGEGAAETGRAGGAREAASAAFPDSAGEARGTSRGDPRGRRAASNWSLGVQLAFLVAVFGVVVLVAELAGAANLGVALGVGQIAFAIAVIYLLLRR